MNDKSAGCRIHSRGLTHIGCVRERNEDAVLEMPRSGLWAVADGMGGHRDGGYASRAVIKALRRLGEVDSGEALLHGVAPALTEVNAALRRRALQLGEDAVVGSTVVALVLESEHYHCFWAGDSRAYLYRDRQLTRLSRDHATVEGGALTRAVGAADDLELDYTHGLIYEGDGFLLCSDGLTRVVDDAALAVSLCGEPPGEAACALIGAALIAGAPDNVSVVTVQLAD